MKLRKVTARDEWKELMNNPRIRKNIVALIRFLCASPKSRICDHVCIGVLEPILSGPGSEPDAIFISPSMRRFGEMKGDVKAFCKFIRSKMSSTDTQKKYLLLEKLAKIEELKGKTTNIFAAHACLVIDSASFITYSVTSSSALAVSSASSVSSAPSTPFAAFVSFASYASHAPLVSATDQRFLLAYDLNIPPLSESIFDMISSLQSRANLANKQERRILAPDYAIDPLHTCFGRSSGLEQDIYFFIISENNALTPVSPLKDIYFPMAATFGATSRAAAKTNKREKDTKKEKKKKKDSSESKDEKEEEEGEEGEEQEEVAAASKKGKIS
jgi:hypothetical protein